MKKQVSEIFTNNLRQRMNELHFTATKVAENCNLSRNTIENLHNGHAKMIKFSTIAELCKALYVQPGYFFKESK